MIKSVVKLVIVLLLIASVESFIIKLIKDVVKIKKQIAKGVVNTIFGPYKGEVNIPLNILVHLQGIGDFKGHHNQWVGTKGQSRRLQGFIVQLANKHQRDQVFLEYMAHLQHKGDVEFVSESNFVGTRGESRRLQGFAIRLVGKNAHLYEVRYSAHLQHLGDTLVFRNGQFCGTRGQSRRVQAIFVTLVKKNH